jgi:undecaprenyl-diphosphatase
MDWHHLLRVILIAIVEGVTEFLPVSSTGHMVLAGELIGFKGTQEASLEIIIQLGAILAVCVVYWRRLWAVIAGLLRWEAQAVLFTRNVLLAFLPAMILGALFYARIKALLEKPALIAWALILGGIAILVIERMQHRATTKSVESMSVRTALGIGVAQCLAMIPGVSRSGATIMGALTMGVERKTAAEFTFFLAIPTMAAATAKDIWENGASMNQSDMLSIGIGFVVAFLVALVVVKAFVGFVSRYGFAPFAWYRIVVGVAALAWLGLR